MAYNPERLVVAGCLASLLACRAEAPRPAPRAPSMPLFAAADSTIYELAALGSSSARMVGIHALGDSDVAIVTSAPGGIALSHFGGQLNIVKGLNGLIPEHSAVCTQGGVVVIGGHDRAVVHVGVDGSVAPAGALPRTIGRVLGLQCESPSDLLVLAEGSIPDVKTASLVRVGSALVRVSRDRDSVRVDTLGAFSGHELLRLSPNDPGIDPPFGVTVQLASGPTRLYVASTDESMITQIQTNGRRLGAIDFVSDDVPIPRTRVDSAVRATLGARLTTLPPNVADEMISGLAKDRKAARWVGLAVDPGENVWLALNVPPDRDGDRVWTIFRTDGARRAKVFLPFDFVVTDVRPQFVLGYLKGLPAARSARKFKLQLLGG
ncbi:MAG: hypothetical protein U0132_22585 [Gemmatimonadaceae bacterium]